MKIIDIIRMWSNSWSKAICYRNMRLSAYFTYLIFNIKLALIILITTFIVDINIIIFIFALVVFIIISQEMHINYIHIKYRLYEINNMLCSVEMALCECSYITSHLFIILTMSVCGLLNFRIGSATGNGNFQAGLPGPQGKPGQPVRPVVVSV